MDRVAVTMEAAVAVTEPAAEAAVEAGPEQEPKTEAAVAVEPALALVEEPMMPIRKVQQVTAVNPTEVLAARPQRMAPILHRHLPER